VRSFSYSAPRSLSEALPLLGPSARPLAGGTDLLTLMKADLAAPERLIGIRTLLPRDVLQEGEGLVVGAAATLHDIESHPAIREQYTALAQAAAAAASPQLRNMATIGGNLLQRPRCWYFRNPRTHCWLKGGEACLAREGENRLHALFGGSPCVAAHPSDLAPALVAFDAGLQVRAAQGEGRLSMEQLFAVPEEGRRSETRLPDDALILSLRLPSPAPGTRSTYVKAMDRRAFAFALAGVAAVLRLAPGRGVIEHVRVVLSGVAPVPWRSQAAERALLGAEPGERVLQAAAEAAVEGAAALAHNAYKIPLVRALVRRALDALVSPARGRTAS
jgi:xanthine dehydrogenase YagS FAD-binding subunit